jgi:hypothetical protein
LSLPGERGPERAEKSPVAVQARQMNERGQVGITVEPDLNAAAIGDARVAIRNAYLARRPDDRDSSRDASLMILFADHFFAKIRLASSKVSWEPMSYQRPGTFQT